MIRKIIHVDMDAFFASVEIRDRPELRGRPLIVGGDPKSRGVVCAASYEARRYGVHSAMSCSKAFRLCPEAVFLPPDIKKYVAVSRQIREIFFSVTPKVEPLSIDEAYLDVTENLLDEPLAVEVAKFIKKEIRAKTGLTASAGVGPNKFIAKIASDLRKPDGLVVVAPQKVAQFVERLPVEKLWGVGPATARKLQSMGIFTTAHLRQTSLAELETALGSYASFLQGLARGEDPREVETDQETKSCGTETTFAQDLYFKEEILPHLARLAEDIASELAELKLPARTFTLKIRYNDFSTITRSKTLPLHVHEPEIIQKVLGSLLEKTDAGLRPVRLIGASASQLMTETEWIQLWLNFPQEVLAGL